MNGASHFSQSPEPRADVFEHLRVPVSDSLGVDIGGAARKVVSEAKQAFALCSNPRVSPEFIDRIAIIGGGKYGTAIGDLLALAGNDVAVFARDPVVARDIQVNHRNNKCLGDRQLSANLVASCSRGVALCDRGIILLAVPTSSLEDQINSLRPHPDSIVVNLAKGLIIKGWKPSAEKEDFSKGPPKGCEVYLPLEYMRRHPNFEFVKAVAMVSGPGFADDLRTGAALDLSVTAHYRDSSAPYDRTSDKAMRKQIAAHVASKFQLAEVTTELTTDYVGVQICAAMKNVLSVMVGVCDGLTQTYGEQRFPSSLREKIKRFGMQEAQNIIKWKQGKARTVSEPCGWSDLHLSTSKTTGRNYSLGLALATDRRVDQVIKASGNVVEGVAAAWGVKLLTDDRPAMDGKPAKPGIYTPVTNALIDIFGGKMAASVVMEKLLTELRKVSMNEIHNWQSEIGRIGLHRPDKE